MSSAVAVKHLVCAEARHESQGVAQEVAAADGDERDRADRPGDVEPGHPVPGATVHSRKQGQEGQDRDHREVLEQQDREGQAAVASGEFTALGERLQGKGGRRQRQGETGDHGGLKRQSQRDGKAGECRGGQRELPAAQPETPPGAWPRDGVAEVRGQ